MKQERAFADIFSVGYDDKSGEIPVLVIGRNTKHGIDVINVFKGEAAKDIYRQLTTPSTLKL